MVAKQFRVVATRLRLLRSERKSTVVVITSALKGEGKTTIALNVAYALARDLGKLTL
jgi:Mrp family chromosome partitioning ATPase